MMGSNLEATEPTKAHAVTVTKSTRTDKPTPSPLGMAMGDLELTIKNLKEDLVTLADEINPILSGEMADPAEKMPEETYPGNSDIVNLIHDQRRRVLQINRMVQEIRNRVEV